jgi:2-desacetyl-2-hydroxyethyl bacteriochlorophyllide A dehydrogenase
MSWNRHYRRCRVCKTWNTKLAALTWWFGGDCTFSKHPFSVILKIVDTRRSLLFVAPRRLEVRSEDLPTPGARQALVRSMLSAISSGTERLVYTGLFPEDLPTDETIAALSGSMHYPLKYGYSMVGEVTSVGPDVDPVWIGRRVFAFNPHESAFLVDIDGLQPVPDGISDDDAVFLPNMETALNLVMDGRPLIGERVAVLGQGIVGLLTAALLARFPLETLATFDGLPRRRDVSLQVGAAHSLDPGGGPPPGLSGSFDLCYELSGVPEALNLAIQLTGFDGRIVIGSWYGRKQAPLNLGGRFHRSRICLISSQVSTLASELSGRWTKQRRFDLAWQMLRQVRPAKFITHRFALAEAERAYRLLDEQPGDALQVVLTYP